VGTVKPPVGRAASCNAYDYVRLVVDPNALTQNGSITMEPCLPKVVAQHRFIVATPVVLLGREEPPYQGLNSEYIKIASGDEAYV
jgi:hypothetical protein